YHVNSFLKPRDFWFPIPRRLVPETTSVSMGYPQAGNPMSQAVPDTTTNRVVGAFPIPRIWLFRSGTGALDVALTRGFGNARARIPAVPLAGKFVAGMLMVEQRSPDHIQRRLPSLRLFEKAQMKFREAVGRGDAAKLELEA